MDSYAMQAESEAWDAIAASERPSTERAGYRRLEARYAGSCDSCATAIAKGQPILYNRRHELRLLCLECGARADAGANLERSPDAPARMTTRERREARLEKRREWADSRSAKASSEYASARERADVIPFGQPILVGHHSEGRDRNYRAGISRSFERSFEHSEKAREHESAARGLEEQLARSIYDDDPDVIERLEHKLAGLELERDRWKAYNAACRKAKGSTPDALELLDDRQRANVESLTRVCPYQLGKNGEVTYTNLSATINRTRQRLERLRRQKGA